MLVLGGEDSGVTTTLRNVEVEDVTLKLLS